MKTEGQSSRKGLGAVALDVVALIPVIGAVKYLTDIKKLVKVRDIVKDVDIIGKNGDEITDLAGVVEKNTDEITKIGKDATKTADSVIETSYAKSSENLDQIRKIMSEGEISSNGRPYCL